MIPILKTIAQALALAFVIVVTGYALLLIYGVLSAGEIAKLSESEKLTLAISIFSSAGALFASYAAWNANRLSKSEAQANREHNRLSVRPMLVVDASASTLHYSYSLLVSNNGLGPASIRKYDIFLAGKRLTRKEQVTEGVNDYIANFYNGPDYKIFFEIGFLSVDTEKSEAILSPNNSRTLVRIDIKTIDNKEISSTKDTGLEKLCSGIIDYIYKGMKVDIEYEDIYREPHKASYEALDNLVTKN